MSDNTIFGEKGNQQQAPSVIPPSQPLPPEKKEQVPEQQVQPKAQVPKAYAAWQETLSSDESHNNDSFFSSSLFSLLIKVIIGIVVLGVIGFLLFRFVLPLFSQKSPENVTINYWGLWEDPQVVQSIIADFQKENPAIKVTYTKQDIKQYKDRLFARSENGTGPDVFRFHNTWLPQVSLLLLPLPNDVITKEDLQKNYYPVVQQDVIKNGAIYGVPLEIDTLSLFINTEIFQAAGVSVPTTWEEFGRTARVLTVKDESGVIKTAGAALGTFDNIMHASDIISLLLVQNGTDLYNLSQTQENASDALHYYASFAKDEGNVWDATIDSSIVSFSRGNLAMYFGYSWDIFTIKALNPNIQFSVHAVPVLSNRATTIASYWVEGVSAKSKYQKESLLFLKFLAKKETQQKLFTQSSKTRLFGEPYSRVDLAPLLKDNELVYPFVSQGQFAVSSFFASDTFDSGLNAQMNGYLGNAVRAILDNTSSQTASETLAQGVAQVLQQYGR